MIEKNAILLHGFFSQSYYDDPSTPSPSNAHWFPWLQKQLMVHGIKTDTPEVFRGYRQVWSDWAQEIERFDINENTLLIGHSMGGGTLIRYMTEHPDIRVDSIILIAPWLNIDHSMDTDFLTFPFSESITTQAKRIIILHSDDDYEPIQASIRFLQDKLKQATFIPFHHYGHFTTQRMPSNTFPELLEIIVNDKNNGNRASSTL